MVHAHRVDTLLLRRRQAIHRVCGKRAFILSLTKGKSKTWLKEQKNRPFFYGLASRPFFS